MPTLPMRGYKRKPFPTLDTDKEGIKQFVVDEFQRLENTLETHKQAVDVNTSENEVVKTSVSNLTATVNSNTADITAEQTARASADSALASDITSLTATVTQQGTDLTAAEAAITNEQTVRANADSALASDITSLTATVNQQGTDLTAAEAAITSEQTARANADSALASDITSLTSTVNQQGTDLTAAQAAITSEQTTRANADSALASDITSLTSTVNQQGTDLTAAQADITAEQTARANADSALASDITSLTSTVNTNNTTLSAAITNEQTARANADSALATDITNLTATVGTNTSSITTEASVRAAADSALQTSVNTAIANAATAQSTADGKIDTFYQTSAPSSASLGDLWFDTNDKNKLYRYDGSSWVNARDSDIAQAITDAAGAQSTADGKVTTFYQNNAPTAEGTGDLWVDTNDGNKLYRWSGSSWLSVQDTAITTAIQNAATAQSTADGKIDTFYQASAPSSASTGDLWFDTNDKNKLYRYDGSSWANARDSDIAQAITDAAGAQSTADGKVTTFYQNDAPTAEGTGDLWVDTNDGNKLYRWSGSSWLSVQDSTIPALEAKYGVKLNVNGYITGFEQNNNGTTGSFKILADEFKIVEPGAAAGSSGVEVFDVSGGYATIKNIRSAATGARLQIDSDVLKVYDSSGTLRVKLGNLA